MPQSTTVDRSDQQGRPGAHRARGRVPGARATAPGAALGARAATRCEARGRSPGGTLDPDETLEQSIRRHLATKVDVREVAHLEQLEHAGATRPASGAVGARDRVPRASCRSGSIRACRADTRWHAGRRASARRRSTTARSSLAGRERLRGKLSYTNLGFALAPETFTLAELRDLYEAALGHEVSATNLKRVLLRARSHRGDRRASCARPVGRAAGRALPLLHPPARGHRSVRRPAPAFLTAARLDRSPESADNAEMRHVRLWLLAIGAFSLVAQAIGAAAVLWRGPARRLS